MTQWVQKTVCLISLVLLGSCKHAGVADLSATGGASCGTEACISVDERYILNIPKGISPDSDVVSNYILSQYGVAVAKYLWDDFPNKDSVQIAGKTFIDSNNLVGGLAYGEPEAGVSARPYYKFKGSSSSGGQNPWMKLYLKDIQINWKGPTSYSSKKSLKHVIAGFGFLVNRYSSLNVGYGLAGTAGKKKKPGAASASATKGAFSGVYGDHFTTTLTTSISSGEVRSNTDTKSTTTNVNIHLMKPPPGVPGIGNTMLPNPQGLFPAIGQQLGAGAGLGGQWSKTTTNSYEFQSDTGVKRTISDDSQQQQDIQYEVSPSQFRIAVALEENSILTFTTEGVYEIKFKWALHAHQTTGVGRFAREHKATYEKEVVVIDGEQPNHFARASVFGSTIGTRYSFKGLHTGDPTFRVQRPSPSGNGADVAAKFISPTMNQVPHSNYSSLKTHVEAVLLNLPEEVSLDGL